MTNKFANSTSHSVAAIAVGSGNMPIRTQDNSENAPQIPIIHFHGTADSTVPYDGTSPFIPSVENTVGWWVNHNNCNTTPIVTQITDLDPNDNSTVEKYYYGNGDNDSEITFYKVIDGGHTWSGSYSIPLFGATNKDINQSELIGDFFADKCSSITSVEELANEGTVNIYPNPFNELLVVNTIIETTVNLYNCLGKVVLSKTIHSSLAITTTKLIPSVYFYEIIQNHQLLKSGKLIKK